MTNSEPIGWNWSRTHCFGATELRRPTSIGELQQSIVAAVASGQGVRTIGSRHSFTDIADSDVVVDLGALPEQFAVSPDRTSVTVSGAMTYARLASLLEPHQLAIANMASLPHLSIAGAISTATHGSGTTNGNLATAVLSLKIMTSAGELRHVQRSDTQFSAAVVALGAMGAIVAIELAVEPAFDVEQAVHNRLSWSRLHPSLDEVFDAAYSVSVFTDWRDHVQLWTKRRVDQATLDHATLHDGVQASQPEHPVPGADASSCTNQQEPGLWSHRLPHFRSDEVPSVGAEVQSEFFVERALMGQAIERLRSIGDALEPVIMVSEIRTIGADNIWLSPQYQRDCAAFHFTWHHDVVAAHAAADLVTDTLAPLRPIPHWGKVFDPRRFDFDQLYPNLRSALACFQEWDPTSTFTNAWMRNTISGSH